MKQLERLLVLQGQRCFFCDGSIPAGEASVEHLVATANGGSNSDDNCVVCCKALNTAFGSKQYKEKLRSVLSHKGPFVCPRPLVALAHSGSGAPELTEPADKQVALVLQDLIRRGAHRPRKEKTLRNTVAATFQPKLADADASDLVARLQARAYVSISEDGSVGYKLPGAVA